MDSTKLKELRIEKGSKRRSGGSIWTILLLVALLTGAAAYLAWPRAEDSRRVVDTHKTRSASSAVAGTGVKPMGHAANSVGKAVLTVSGYIINRERIELSPRFMGVVKWIGVKKGDSVTNGQVVVLLDDAEYKARLLEAEGRLANAQVAVEKARLDRARVQQLSKIESRQAEDNARLAVEAAQATVKEIAGQIALIRIYLDWTVIHSPIDGVVLEKLVDPNELVTPQSFGGTRGPSTALIALADLKDLQVEIELNESDLAKVFLDQKCKVSPEAYPDKDYDGYVAEIAPEANRQKGTLQVKVQILDPDRYLTPELSAKVDFLSATRTTAKVKKKPGIEDALER
jgi:HlyD family secretion protein